MSSVRLHDQPIWRIVKAVDEDADHGEDGDDHNRKNRFAPVRQLRGPDRVTLRVQMRVLEPSRILQAKAKQPVETDMSGPD